MKATMYMVGSHIKCTLLLKLTSNSICVYLSIITYSLWQLFSYYISLYGPNAGFKPIALNHRLSDALGL